MRANKKMHRDNELLKKHRHSIALYEKGRRNNSAPLRTQVCCSVPPPFNFFRFHAFVWLHMNNRFVTVVGACWSGSCFARDALDEKKSWSLAVRDCNSCGI